MYGLGARCLCWQGAELFISKASAHSTTRCRLQKYVKAVFLWQKGEHSSTQDECSGSAAFVVAPSGCFLRKLLWPVCAASIKKILNRNCFYLYIAQPLPNRAFLFAYCTIWAVDYTWLHSLERQHGTAENKRATAEATPRASSASLQSLVFFFTWVGTCAKLIIKK